MVMEAWALVEKSALASDVLLFLMCKQKESFRTLVNSGPNN